MEAFEEIRPYRDSEVSHVLSQLIADREFHDTVARFRFPRLQNLCAPLGRTLVRAAVRNEIRGISDIPSFQQVVKKYFDRVIASSTSGFTVSGAEHLESDAAYLFISNHRDIALDPAFVNIALSSRGHDTARIAIGDNLLSKPFAAHLMRLNKSFIVNRSAKGRQMLLATKNLSNYIRMSVMHEKVSVWLAQREGRAKDSLDKTEPAIIKMLSLSLDRKAERFGDLISKLKIVPVSISYEWDPCDAFKATELAVRTAGQTYEKGAHEDLRSIGAGIVGKKGAVHVHFGKVLQGDFTTPEEVANAIDAQIWENYMLHPSNFVAYEMRYGTAPILSPNAGGKMIVSDRQVDTRAEIETRLGALGSHVREFLLDIYANPVISRLKVAR